MKENYQAVFDAVKVAYEHAAFIAGQAANEQLSAAYEAQRPCVLFKPKIYMDGNEWCALLGENIQNGVCGFGDSPAKAFAEFDKNFNRAISS